jgi:hypothetical protein
VGGETAAGLARWEGEGWHGGKARDDQGIHVAPQKARGLWGWQSRVGAQNGDWGG